MAVETTMNQGKRRFVFGLNVAVSVVLANLTADLLYSYLDPRIKMS